MLVPVSTDASMDGLLIGIAFVAGNLSAGLIMSIALAIEMMFLGISTSMAIQRQHIPKVISIPICLMLPQLILIFAFIGASVLSALSGPAFVAMLSFGLAALLFLVADELLVEAHKSPDKWWITIWFYFGFAFVIVLQKAEVFWDKYHPDPSSSSSL